MEWGQRHITAPYHESVKTRMFVATGNAVSVHHCIKQSKNLEKKSEGRGRLVRAARTSGQESFVPSWILQFAFTAAAVLYLGRFRLTLHQRKKQSWDDLFSQLNSAWPAPIAFDLEPGNQPDCAARLWNLYRNAQVLQQIASYALADLDLADRERAQQLHRDATHLRFWALAALARYAIGRPVKT
jgi:hypothetical protein